MAPKGGKMLFIEQKSTMNYKVAGVGGIDRGPAGADPGLEAVGSAAGELPAAPPGPTSEAA
eukprot:5744757-Heterocapsa_arctica.AAC.1